MNGSDTSSGASDVIPSDVSTVDTTPSAMIVLNFASREPLSQAPGLLSFARTRRMCYVANFTATCPEMAPEGWTPQPFGDSTR